MQVFFCVRILYMKTFTTTSNSLEDTQKIAQAIAQSLQKGLLICLYGDIGTGKTTLTKTIGGALGVKENITSPSFVIMTEYHSGRLDLYHFDLYRLETEGLHTIQDELREYSTDENALMIVEWAEFGANELDLERLEIKIDYIEDTVRGFTFNSFGVDDVLAKIGAAL